MSYLVFARKWRPKDFDEVVGQEHVTKTLQSAIRSNKIAHAYLFAGPQGVGKTSCARILAKALNCEKGVTDKPCGTCAACSEIAEGRSLDVIEIDGASNRGIDEIRTLRENVKFAPLGGRTKIYIIDEVHMLTPEAFNALLKTLEEPPAYVKFIFATTQPHKVLPTILSRCQRFDFTRLPHVKIIEKLKEIASSEKMEMPDDVFFAIAKASEGSMRDAESILDQLVSFSQKDVKLKDVVSVLGIIEQDVFFNFVGCVVSQEAAGAINIIADCTARGKDLNNLLEGLLEYYRNLMILKIVKSERETLVDLPQDALLKVTQQSQHMSLTDIMTSINQIFAAQDMAKKLNSARIPLEVLAVKLSMLGTKKPLPAPMAILKEEKGSVGAAACTLEDVKNKWEPLIENLSQVKMSLATYLKEAVPMSIKDGSLTIGFPKSAVFFKEALAHKDNLKILERSLNSVLSSALNVNLAIVEGLVAEKKEPEEIHEDSPFLKSALDLFKGKVIKKT